MSGNYFVRVVDTEGDAITFRPEALTHVVEYDGADFVVIFLGEGISYEIPKGQLALDVLHNHSQHAGVRTLN